MSAPAAAPAPGGDAAPKQGKKKLIIILAVVGLVLALAGGGAMFYMKKKAAEEEAAAAEEGGGEAAHHVEKKKEKKKEHKKDDKHALPVFVPLDPFVVNLADREADRFVQVGVTFEVDDAHVAEELKAYMPAIRNNILMLLAHKNSHELMTIEGKEKLARQIRREAVLPMGIHLEDEDAEEEEPGAKKKRKQRFDSLDDSPVKEVKFSSFIIQ